MRQRREVAVFAPIGLGGLWGRFGLASVGGRLLDKLSLLVTLYKYRRGRCGIAIGASSASITGICLFSRRGSIIVSDTRFIGNRTAVANGMRAIRGISLAGSTRNQGGVSCFVLSGRPVKLACATNRRAMRPTSTLGHTFVTRRRVAGTTTRLLGDVDVRTEALTRRCRKGVPSSLVTSLRRHRRATAGTVMSALGTVIRHGGRGVVPASVVTFCNGHVNVSCMRRCLGSCTCGTGNVLSSIHRCVRTVGHGTRKTVFASFAVGSVRNRTHGLSSCMNGKGCILMSF